MIEQEYHKVQLTRYGTGKAISRKRFHKHGIQENEVVGSMTLTLKGNTISQKRFHNREKRQEHIRHWRTIHNLDTRKDWYIDIKLD